MNKRTSVVGLIAAALLSGLLPMTSAGASTAACAGARGSGAMATTFYTYTIDAKPLKKVYRIGEKMKVALKVQRPGREDPLGEGQPISSPAYLPAEGVNVSVSLYLGDYHYRYGMGVTDANGESTVSIPPFPKEAPAGPVRAAVSGRSYYNQGGCPDLEEVGYNYYEPFFKAVK